MGATGDWFQQIRELEVFTDGEDKLLELMTEEEYREDLHKKYGYSVAYTMMLQQGETNE